MRLILELRSTLLSGPNGSRSHSKLKLQSGQSSTENKTEKKLCESDRDVRMK
ncbi:hypothetical protein ABG768_003816, partial [Culter alburnus]